MNFGEWYELHYDKRFTPSPFLDDDKYFYAYLEYCSTYEVLPDWKVEYLEETE